MCNVQRAACWVREGISIYESDWMAFHPVLASSILHHFSDITMPNSQTHQNKSEVTSANIYFFKFQEKNNSIRAQKLHQNQTTIPQAFEDQGYECITYKEFILHHLASSSLISFSSD